MISLKSKKLRFTILICFAITILVIGGWSILENSCGIKHILLIYDVSSYENTLDPEFCEDLTDRIDSFNSQCNPQMEFLDCG